MRYIHSLLLWCAVASTSMSCYGQGWTYSDQFRTDFWTGPVDYKVETVDCSTGKHGTRNIGTCMRQDVANGLSNGTVLKQFVPKTGGLSKKIATGVAAQRPRRTSASTSRITASSMSEARRTGKNYNYSTSKQHQKWKAQKRAQQANAQERRRQKAIQRKIADDNRAAAVTATINSQLQGDVDRRIQNDYYNAGKGAVAAQGRARDALRTVGPQYKKQQTTGKQHAQLLKGQNKPRRVMYPQNQPKNTVRKQLPPVKRTSLNVMQETLLKKALTDSAEARQKAENEKAWNEYKGIKLSDNAVSTLGKDWNSDDFKSGPLAPPPSHPRPTYVEPEWLTKHKEMLIMLGEPPLTKDEEIWLMKQHEFLGV